MVYTDIYINLVNKMVIKRRAVDFIWRKNTYRLDQIVEESGNNVLYYLKDEPDRNVLREKMMYILEDNLVPPEWMN